MRFSRTLRWLSAASVLSALGVAAFLSRAQWMPLLVRSQLASAPSADPLPQGEEANVLKISVQARENLGLVSKPARMGSYSIKVQIPGVVADLPGRSDRVRVRAKTRGPDMRHGRNCEGVLRRDCLQLGLGALMGGSLASALQLRAVAATAPSKATGCILIWLDGGPSHIETFDPKPNAPSEIRGEFQTIQAKVPGTVFSENMVRLAAIADKFSVVRSVKHNQNNHGAGNHYMMTGSPTRIPVSCGAFVSFHPSMGSVVSFQRGAENGLPPYFSLPSQTRSGGPNFLGARHAPFVVGDDPNKKSFRVRDVTIPSVVTDARAVRRRKIRSELDSLLRYRDRATADPVLGADENYDQALSLVTSAAAQKAFEIQREPDAVRDRFGRNALGQRALLARRLVEGGVPFVTINNGGWDHHSNIFPRFKSQGRELESVVATLIEDLEERGMLDTTLVVVMGEFGRTPKISTLPGSKTPGRDHWSSAMSILVAGCGTPAGQIIGATDKNGYTAVEQIYGPENLVSSIYLKLGIDPDTIVYNRVGRPTHLVSDDRPIQELMG